MKWYILFLLITVGLNTKSQVLSCYNNEMYYYNDTTLKVKIFYKKNAIDSITLLGVFDSYVKSHWRYIKLQERYFLLTDIVDLLQTGKIKEANAKVQRLNKLKKQEDKVLKTW